MSLSNSKNLSFKTRSHKPFCPEPALTDEGQPQTAESTPTDNPLSNGVPVSDVFSFDEYQTLIFAMSCYRSFYSEKPNFDMDEYEYHWDKSEKLETKLRLMLVQHLKTLDLNNQGETC